MPYTPVNVLNSYGQLGRDCAWISICRCASAAGVDAGNIQATDHGSAAVDHDSALHGEPVVSNGMSLCRLHHAAFDRLLLGVHPDYVIHVRPDILYEIDGPMLKHGLQGLQGQRIVVPSRRVERPDEGRLGERWERFLGGVA